MEGVRPGAGASEDVRDLRHHHPVTRRTPAPALGRPKEPRTRQTRTEAGRAEKADCHDGGRRDGRAGALPGPRPRVTDFFQQRAFFRWVVAGVPHAFSPRLQKHEPGVGHPRPLCSQPRVKPPCRPALTGFWQM